MATVAFGIVGAGIGAFVDPLNPAQGAMWGWSIGTVVGGLLFPPSMPATSLGKLDDLRVSSSSYGTFVPQVWGQFRVAGQYIWSTLLQEHTQGSSGKGGVSIYTYTASFAVLVCKGPVKSIGRIWMNDMIVYDPNVIVGTIPSVLVVSGAGFSLANGTYTLLSTFFSSSPNTYTNGTCYITYVEGEWYILLPNGSIHYYINTSGSTNVPLTGWTVVTGTTGPAPTITVSAYEPVSATTAAGVTIEGIYLGTRGQSADPLMTASLSASGNPNPAYTGYCYITFQDCVLTNYGNRLPNVQVEVFGYGETAAEVIFDVLTSNKLIPNNVLVSGAGTIGVNGTYIPITPPMDVISEGVNFWSNGTYTLMQVLEGASQLAWILCTISGSTITVYYNNLSTSIIPPTVGWTVSVGAANAPTLQILNTTGDFDVSAAMSVDIVGYCNGASQMGKAIIEPLLMQKYADVIEADGQLKYIPRGSTPVRTLGMDDLGVVLWDKGGQKDDTVPIKYRRQQAWELPTLVQVNYYQYNADLALCNYLQAMQVASRTTLNTQQNIVSYTFPSIMTDQEAAQLAQLLLYTAWIEIETYTTTVGLRNIDLMPSDIVQVNSGGQNRRVRILGDNMNIPGIQELSFVADDWSVLSQYVQGGTTGGIGSTSITSSGLPIMWLALQTNAFTSTFATDGYVHVYLGASWQSGGNNQCITYVSLDGGASWVYLSTLTQTILMGPCTSTLGNYTGAITTIDTTNTVDIYLQNGSFLSCSTADLANGVNTIYVGGEIIQFQTATNIGSNTYQLSNLLRGQHGTTNYMVGHSAGETAMVLDTNLVIYKTQPTPYGSGPAIGTELMFKFTFTGNSTSYTQTITLESPEWMCYPVSGVSATRTSGNINMSWTENPRYQASPLPDEPFNFDILIYTDNTYSALERTITSSTTSCIYTSVQQVTDFGANQATVYVQIYQTNTLAGNGYIWQGSL